MDVTLDDAVPFLGALVPGFAFFLVADYFHLFEVGVLDSDLFYVYGGVVVGYSAARYGRQ